MTEERRYWLDTMLTIASSVLEAAAVKAEAGWRIY